MSIDDRYLDQLGERECQMLAQLVGYAAYCEQAWVRAVESRRFVRSIAWADRLLHGVRLINSLIEEADSQRTDGYDTVDNEVLDSAEHLPLVVQLAFPEAPQIEELIQTAYPPEAWNELRRGLSDFQEVSVALFAKLLPAVLLRVIDKAHPVVPDIALMFETSSQLEHIEYHLETDLIESSVLPPCWDEGDSYPGNPGMERGAGRHPDD